MKNSSKILLGTIAPFLLLLISSMKLMYLIVMNEDTWLSYVGYIGAMLIAVMFYYENGLMNSVKEEETLRHQRELELINARRDAEAYITKLKFQQQRELTYSPNKSYTDPDASKN